MIAAVKAQLARAPSLDGIVRSRRARLALMTGLVAFGSWAFAPHVLSDVSTEASVNAPIIRVTAPADGTVADLPPLGTLFAASAEVTPVEASADTGALADLASEADLANASKQLLLRQLRELDAERSRMSGRVAAFSSAAVMRSDAALAEAQADASACLALQSEATQALARAEKLAATGFVSAAGLERARTAATAAESACQSANARVRTSRIEAITARRGVFLAADSYNDAPYSSQQLDRLLLQRQAVESQAAAAADRAAEAERRLKAAQARMTYAVPQGAVVWSHHASSGSAIRAGEPVLDLVDCRRRFLEVSMPERNAAVIDQTEPVRVRLLGTSDWLSGFVLRIKGASARRNDPLVASSVRRSDDEYLTVEVSLPPAKGHVAMRRCDIGRSAEVRFSRLG